MEVSKNHNLLILLEKFGILKKNLNIYLKHGTLLEVCNEFGQYHTGGRSRNDGRIRKNRQSQIVNPIKVHVSSLNFKVTMDGMELKKP